MILCNFVLADYIIHNGQWHHTIPQYFNDDEKWRPHVIYEQIFCFNIDIDAEIFFSWKWSFLSNSGRPSYPVVGSAAALQLGSKLAPMPIKGPS